MYGPPYSNVLYINVTPPATYYARVSITNPSMPNYPSGYTFTSPVFSFSPPGVGTPTGMTMTQGSASFTISWPAVTGATAYNVKFSTVSGGPYSVVARGTTALSWTYPAAAPNTFYYVVVSAVNAWWVESPNSAQVVGYAKKVLP